MGVVTIACISIVEDDEAFADLLQEYLTRYQQVNRMSFQILCYRNGAEFLEHYQTGTDIVLMDIELPVMDGMTAARALRKLDTQVVLIFVTNLAQYAIHGYEVEALDYIVKPVSYPQFALKMDKAMRSLPMRDTGYVIHTKEGQVRVDCSRIYYLESRDHMVLFHTSDGVYESRITLSSAEQSMRRLGFSRPSNSFLVNLRYVQTVKNNKVVMRAQEFSIGRSRRKSFMDDLSAYLGGGSLHA